MSGWSSRSNPDGTIVTIEGNTDRRGGRTGGQVMRRRRRAGIVGYGVPAYDGTRRAASNGRPMLQQGSAGPAVRTLQRRLVQLGVALDVDGEFGPRTEAAVRKFQRTRGLEVDGVVGPKTWHALRRP